MDIIYINNLKIKTIIGVYARERQIKQTVVLNIELGSDISRAAASDEMTDTIDYSAIVERLSAFVSNSKFKLLESLATNIADLLLNEFQVPWLKLYVAKPYILKNVDEIGIMIERQQGNKTDLQ